MNSHKAIVKRFEKFRENMKGICLGFGIEEHDWTQVENFWLKEVEKAEERCAHGKYCDHCANTQETKQKGI